MVNKPADDELNLAECLVFSLLIGRQPGNGKV